MTRQPRTRRETWGKSWFQAIAEHLRRLDQLHRAQPILTRAARDVAPIVGRSEREVLKDLTDLVERLLK